MRVNLLPKDQRPLKQSQVRWEFLVGLFGVLALGSALFFSWLAISQVNSLQANLLEAESREYLLERQVQGVQGLRTEITNLETRQKSYGALFIPREKTLGLLPSLTNHPFDQLWIESLVWNEQVVQLDGYTKKMTSLSQYLNFLNERSEQATLQLVNPQEDSGFYLFSIQVRGVKEND